MKTPDGAEITGRDDFIVGLALAYAITVMRAVDRHGRMPKSDYDDVCRLFARYPEYLQKGMLLSAYITAVGEAPPGYEPPAGAAA